jgi:hypothetical protein
VVQFLIDILSQSDASDIAPFLDIVNSKSGYHTIAKAMLIVNKQNNGYNSQLSSTTNCNILVRTNKSYFSIPYVSLLDLDGITHSTNVPPVDHTTTTTISGTAPSTVMGTTSENVPLALPYSSLLPPQVQPLLNNTPIITVFCGIDDNFRLSSFQSVRILHTILTKISRQYILVDNVIVLTLRNILTQFVYTYNNNVNTNSELFASGNYFSGNSNTGASVSANEASADMSMNYMSELSGTTGNTSTAPNVTSSNAGIDVFYQDHLNIKMICECLFIYCDLNQSDVEVLYDFIPVLTFNTYIHDFQFIVAYFEYNVIQNYSIANKIAILNVFISSFNNYLILQEYKVKALQV